MNKVSGGWILVLTTTSNHEEAEKIARKLLEEKLAACINIIDNVDSLFWWKNKIDRAKESLMIIKSRVEKLGKVIKIIRENHSYEVPEIIALPILAGSPDYLSWIDETVNHVNN